MQPEPATEKLARFVLIWMKIGLWVLGSFVVLVLLVLAFLVTTCADSIERAERQQKAAEPTRLRSSNRL